MVRRGLCYVQGSDGGAAAAQRSDGGGFLWGVTAGIGGDLLCCLICGARWTAPGLMAGGAGRPGGQNGRRWSPAWCGWHPSVLACCRAPAVLCRTWPARVRRCPAPAIAGHGPRLADLPPPLAPATLVRLLRFALCLFPVYHCWCRFLMSLHRRLVYILY